MATQTKYVDPGATGTGDGSSYTNAFTSMDAALNDAAINKSTSDTWVVLCRCLAAANRDTAQLVVDGTFNTTAAQPIIFRADSSQTYGRHSGTLTLEASSPQYFRLYNNSTYCIVQSAAAHLVFDGIQFENYRAWASTAQILAVAQGMGAGSVVFKNCLFALTGTQTTADASYIVQQYSTSGAQVVKFINCVAWKCQGMLWLGTYNADANKKYVFHNCTIIDADPQNANKGVFDDNLCDGGTGVIKNCYAKLASGASGKTLVDSAGSFAFSVTTSKSSDGLLGSSGSATFVDAANGNFHLAAGDTDLIDAATDLSADGDWPTVDTDVAAKNDIDFATRSGTWDIGADEYVAAAGGQPTTKRFANINFTPNKAGVWVPARF